MGHSYLWDQGSGTAQQAENMDVGAGLTKTLQFDLVQLVNSHTPQFIVIQGGVFMGLWKYFDQWTNGPRL